MLSKKKFVVSLFFFILVLFTRFWGINWSQSFAFNPDENNMVSAILQMNPLNFNPNFFAYGQFPLYLTYLTTPIHNFSTIALTLRFWSAVFSCLSLYIFYLIGKKVFSSKKLALLFLTLIIFTPGLIQSAHFGTTESILIFVFAANIFLSFKIYDHPQKIYYLLLASLISGIGLATKISSLILTIPVFLSLFFLFIKNHSFKKTFLNFCFFISIVLFFGLILSPYNLIDFQNFISSMKYEIGVANGSIQVFYTRQFIGSLPYLFQFQKIFPYTNGVFIYIFSIVGLILIIKEFLKKHHLNVYLLITLFSSLIYFIYQGQLFVKWTRFMSPIFFMFPFLSIFLFQKIKNSLLLYVLIFLSVLPGVYFMRIYFSVDSRIRATNWINKSIPENSQVLSESGNVVNIPLFDSKINVTNFDFYTLDDTLSSYQELEKIIKKSNFIFVPSRRVFKNQDNSSYPLSQRYYRSLFSGELGFFLSNTFSDSNSLFLNSENAEETWSVFDNPVVRIYQRRDEK